MPPLEILMSWRMSGPLYLVKPNWLRRLLSTMPAGMKRRTTLSSLASVPAGCRNWKLLSIARRIVCATLSGGGAILSLPAIAAAVRLDCSE